MFSFNQVSIQISVDLPFRTLDNIHPILPNQSGSNYVNSQMFFVSFKSSNNGNNITSIPFRCLHFSWNVPSKTSARNSLLMSSRRVNINILRVKSTVVWIMMREVDAGVEMKAGRRAIIVWVKLFCKFSSNGENYSWKLSNKLLKATLNLKIFTQSA